MENWKDPKDAPTDKQLLVIDKNHNYFLAKKQNHGDRWMIMYGDDFVWEGSSEYGGIADVEPIGWIELPQVK